MLVPPPNFGMVEESLYRSGQPDQLNFPFLEKLGLRSVIWLAPEEPDVGLYVHATHHSQHFCADQNIEMHHLGVLYRTGTVIGCLRKLQHWNLSAILEEYRRYAGPKVRVMNEQFIELFDEELVFGENQAE